MEKLDKLKGKRATIRSGITKLITKSESQLQVTVEKTDTDNLLEILDQLNQKEVSLKELDSEIENEINDPSEFEKEIKVCEEYTEKLVSIKFKIKSRLNKCKSEVTSGSRIFQNATVSENKTMTAVKLPKLTIEKFSGDSSLWLEFYNSFSNAVDSNESLSKIEKFIYLKSLLTGPAYNTVSGFELTEENYDSCLNLLKDRYGKHDTIITCHMNKLLNIEPVKHSANIKGLRKLYDQCEISIRNLKALGVTSGSYGRLLNPILLKLLPQDLVLEFHRKRDSSKDCEVTELIDFIKSEIECREATLLVDNSANVKNFERGYYGKSNQRLRNFPPKNIPSAAALNTTTKYFCVFCRSPDHMAIKCQNFSDEQKRFKLKKDGRCYKCFLKSHLSSQCKAKLNPCKKCESVSHNELFCSKEIKTKSSENQTLVSSMSEFKNTEEHKSTLLQTCTVSVSSENKCELARILCDSGSERSFIRRDLADALELKPLRTEKLFVYSFGQRKARESTFDIVSLTLTSLSQPRNEINIEALVSNEITGAVVKSSDFRVQQFMRKNGYRLADTGLEKEIKILIGSDFLWQIQLGAIEKIKEGLYATNTLFGWTVQGQTRMESKPTVSCFRVSVESLNNQLKEFWNLESLGIINEKGKSDNNLEIINEFESNLKFSNGRYEARLLWNTSRDQLQNNLEVAKRRFLGLENKFLRNEVLFENYNAIIKEQLSEGIVELCDDDCSSANSYYMPHRPVIRDDKTTTKIRIVYDASSKQSNCLSLNDCLIAGPNLNPNILDIILKFREHKIAFSADIEKAFLQIAIAEEDRDYLRFLYYENCDRRKGMRSYRMTRATFGVTCSPFILASTIKHHIKKYEESHSATFEMLNSSLYVDDLFYGSNSVEEAYYLTTEAVYILEEGGMNLRKFETNSIELKEKWNSTNIFFNRNEAPDTVLKVLGLIWDSNNDNLGLELRPLLSVLNDITCTKRNVLQTAAKVFDPSGFIAPFIIRIKCILQDLWIKGVEWDERFSGDLEEKWKRWCSEVEILKQLIIPRYYFMDINHMNESDIQLHVFSDASPVAFGAVAYFRYIVAKDKVKTSFIMSKSRVAPLKKLTLPRLELMGALIGARIVHYLKSIFLVQDNIFLWTDSTIVLHWIKGSAKNWKPFVSNRIAEIQEYTDPINWRHCEGKNNPADLISRGCAAKELLISKKWWHGPDFLLLPEDQWPKGKTPTTKSPEISEEKRSNIEISCLSTINTTESQVKPILNLNGYSSIMNVYRVTAWIKRFLYNVKRKKDQRKFSELTTEELAEAEEYWIKLVQEESFPDEIKCLKENKQISKESKIVQLNPILSNEGLLLVKGRLQQAKLQFFTKHPIVIPPKHKFTELLVREAHERVFHGGVSDTLVQIREKFWIIKGRQIVKSILRKCIICKRFNASPGNQIMAPLPALRIEEAPPFSVIGLDFGGPLYVKDCDTKHYILLCTCAVTRALHLELVSNLSTETFILAFRRFISRRGLCNTVFSDNAKTFKRAEIELKNIWEIMNHPHVKDFYASHGIKWNYIVEKGAWWGGFYERLIRSVKLALRKTLGKSSLTREQLETVLVEIEGVINSRPMTYVYSDVQEPFPLSPAHFLLGKRITSLPAVKLTCEGHFSNRKLLVKMFNYRERLMQLFWNRWKKEYLLNLRSAHQIVPKNKITDFKVNDIVLIHDEHLPRNLWKLGRIIETYLGRDGKVRSCSVKTGTTVIKRPVQLLYNLELQE